MAQRKAKGSSYSKDHDLKTLRKLALECLDKEIESSELGNWAYEEWHNQSEKSQDKKQQRKIIINPRIKQKFLRKGN